ncbi:MAG: hypothetical protein Q9M08_00140 [Mariprofundus sp.]|nr:hypothetical protein [Mariprofundus sp.]
MGIYFESFAENNFMLTIFYGEVIDEDLKAHTLEALQDKYNTPGKVGLAVICKHASASHLSYKTIFSEGKRMQKAEFRKDGKLAIIAKSLVGYGLAKVYGVATELDGMDETRVLHEEDLDQALQWLGVSDFSAEIKHKIDQLEFSDSTEQKFTSKPH